MRRAGPRNPLRAGKFCRDSSWRSAGFALCQWQGRTHRACVGPSSATLVADRASIDARADRRPNSLSGGEKQRVAIGRALIARPGLLLPDEPPASVDVARKGEILHDIERVRDELRLPMVYVSHAAPEVERLAHAVVPMGLDESAGEAG